MTTECTQVGFEFHSLNHRQIRAQFDGGAISGDGGGLLLREVDKRTGIIRKFAACFTDYRDPERIEHRLEELVAQRVYGLALGYEDLNDHDQLRNDPLLAVLVEKSDPSQEVLAGKSTLNRLELTPATATAEARYKKIVLDHGAVDRLLVDLFLEAHGEAPQQIILDLDATDDPLYGKQEATFLSRLLRTLLLSATVHLLRRVLVVRAAAAVQHRWSGGQRGRVTADRAPDSIGMAAGSHHHPRGLGILPRGTDGLV